MVVFKAMKRAGHSMGYPVFDIMTQVRFTLACVWHANTANGCIVGRVGTGLSTNVWQGTSEAVRRSQGRRRVVRAVFCSSQLLWCRGGVVCFTRV
jgi:hypothetical protein